MLRTMEEEVAERNKADSKSTATSDASSSDHVCLVMFSCVHDLNEANCFKLSIVILSISHRRAIVVAPRFY